MESDGESPALCPFEGPEKLLEVWFAPSQDHIPDTDADGNPVPLEKRGLRAVERSVWEDMLSIVKCKVLSVVYGKEMDAYLLRYVHPFI
jgi:S-adenosylmethionine decarboxylase